jgi:hypothetical protein
MSVGCAMRRVMKFRSLNVLLVAAAACVSAGAVVLPRLVVAAPAGAPSTEGTYLIPANDGYGVADCIATGHSCGKIVADAWCQSHGYRAALSFGVADRADFTGSTPRNAGGGGNEMPMVVNCSK